MDHADLVFRAVCYFRNVGADARAIRSYVSLREPERRSRHHDAVALAALEANARVVRVGERWLVAPAATIDDECPPLAATWQPEDAWILLAMLLCDSGVTCSLVQVFAAADFINHAIPSLTELHGALNRLRTGGFITARRGGFAVTKKSSALLAKARAHCAKRVLDQWRCLERLLQCPCCGRRLNAIRWSIPLDEVVYSAAVAAYSRAARTDRH